MTEAAEREITRTLNLYATAIDTRDWDLLDRVFTADVDLKYPGSGKWNDLALFKEHFGIGHDPIDTSQHVVSNHQILVEGDGANSLCYVTVRHTRNLPNGGNFWEMGGWYDDIWVRTPQGWRIRDRACYGNWWNGNIRVIENGSPSQYDVHSFKSVAARGGIRYLEALKAA